MANYQSAYAGAQHDLYTTRQSLIDLIYPVGAIYMSVNSASPSTLFGGTWEQIQDTFLLAAGQTYTAGSNGGSSTHTHTTQAHTLTATEMPSHTHRIGLGGSNNNGYLPNASTAAGSFINYLSSGNSIQGILQDRAPTQWSTSTFNESTGGGGSHSHGDTGVASSLPPYLAVYMWERIA